MHTYNPGFETWIALESQVRTNFAYEEQPPNPSSVLYGRSRIEMDCIAASKHA